MITKAITYTDFNGNTVTEDFHFNLTRAEVMKLEIGTEGGFTESVKEIIQKKDNKGILGVFEKLILSSYGKVSEDGKRFMKKDPETGRPLSEEFFETEAYSELFSKLVTDNDFQEEFIYGVVSLNAEERAQVKAQAANMASELGLASAT